MGLGTCHPDPLPWCSVEGCAWHVHIYLARSLDVSFSHVAVVLLHISHVVVAVVDAELDTAACANRPSCHVLGWSMQRRWRMLRALPPSLQRDRMLRHFPQQQQP